MKKVIVFCLLSFFMTSVCLAGNINEKKTVVQSTEGIEIDSSTSKSIVKSKNDKNPAKTKRKNRNKYLKYIKKIDKSKNKTRIKERDLKYLNNQLEIKKKKLEELNSKVKKGENQE